MQRGEFRGMQRLFVAVTVATVALCAVSGANAAKLATFSAPGVYTWTVPKGVTKVTFDLYGAQGGNSSKSGIFIARGGLGGRVTATFAVKPGQVFKIVVGGRGGDDGDGGLGGGGRGYRGGAGGGGATSVYAGCASAACDVPSGISSSILVAGGGGGAFGTHEGGDGGGYHGEHGKAICTTNSGQEFRCLSGNGGGGTWYEAGLGGRYPTGEWWEPGWLCFVDLNFIPADQPIDYIDVQASSGAFGRGGNGGFSYDNTRYGGNCDDVRLGGSGGGGGWFGGGGSLSGRLVTVGRNGWGDNGWWPDVVFTGTGGGGSAYISPLALSGSTEGGVQAGDGLVVIRTP